LKKSIGVKIRNNKEIDIEINIIYTIGNVCKSIIGSRLGGEELWAEAFCLKLFGE
jgi:hypothetical protein